MAFFWRYRALDVQTRAPAFFLFFPSRTRSRRYLVENCLSAFIISQNYQYTTRREYARDSRISGVERAIRGV